MRISLRREPLVDTAYRYYDYGDGIQTDTQGRLEWAPVSDVRFRAATACRSAANIVEMFTRRFNLFDATAILAVGGTVAGCIRRGSIATGVPAGTVGSSVRTAVRPVSVLQGGNRTDT